MDFISGVGATDTGSTGEEVPRVRSAGEGALREVSLGFGALREDSLGSGVPRVGSAGSGALRVGSYRAETSRAVSSQIKDSPVPWFPKSNLKSAIENPSAGFSAKGSPDTGSHVIGPPPPQV